jgi:hypothetical protein
VTRIGELGTTLAVTDARSEKIPISVAEKYFSTMKYELGFYIPEDDILHSHCRKNLKSYVALTSWTL